MTDRKKIVLIDDSAFMRKILSDIIREENELNNIITAKNGLEGIDIIEKEQPNIIVLDIHMPVMNGIQVLEQLKEKNIKIPIIVVSSLAQEGNHDTIKALELGAFDFITKPTNIFDMKKGNAIDVETYDDVLGNINVDSNIINSINEIGTIAINFYSDRDDVVGNRRGG